MTDGSACYRLSFPQEGHLLKEAVPALESSHEEADTRLILHAAHAGNSGYSHVIIKSPDTDVAVLAAAHCAQINGTVLFLTGTKQRRRYVNISKVSAALGQNVCHALPGFHSLTGCDSVSAFVGKGKAQGLQLLKSNEAIQKHLQMLGREFCPSDFDSLARSCEEVVCALYGYAHNNINDVRYAMFCSKAGDSSQLLPTRDALLQHIRRANYQAAIWHRALEAQPNVPNPSSHGWLVNGNGHLVIQWMTQPPAPHDLLKLISCNCRSSCSTRRCSCVRGSLPCTDVCGCAGCENNLHSSKFAASNEETADQSAEEDLVALNFEEEFD